MAEAEPNDALPPAADAKVREEWRRLEQQRLDEEIAEARADAAGSNRGPRLRWIAWIAFAVALAAGIAVTIVVNRFFDPRR